MVLMKKRGLSPVIATVLLITLAIVLAGIIFTWMRGFVSEQIEKQGKPIDQICADVQFNVDYQEISNALSLEVVNLGNVPIYGVDIKYVGEKDSSMKAFRFSVPVGESSDVQTIPLVDNPKEIILYPMVLGTVRGKQLNKPVTCLGYGQTINLE